MLDARIFKGKDQVKISNNPLLLKLEHNKPGKERSIAVKEEFIDTYESIVRESSKIFSTINKSDEISSNQVHDITSRIVNAIVKDMDLFTAIAASQLNPANYLEIHLVNVSTISAVIGTTMGYSEETVLELAFGTYLADIG